MSTYEVPPEDRVALEQLTVAHVRQQEIRVALLCYRLRRVWLMLHISLAVPLALLALLHAASVVYYRSI
jgi:hypothetical protein